MQRSRRARYAAPVVVTIAAGGCAGEPVGAHVNPPPPEHVHRNPPAVPEPTAGTGKVAAELPPPSGKGRVEKRADGTCIEYPDLSGFKCPPNATCNPPPPMTVRCPEK